MSKIAPYLQTLTRAERERFADLIEECRAREETIAANASRAEAAVDALRAGQQEFWEAVKGVAVQAMRLRESIGRLYLLTVPARGEVS